MVEDFEDPLGRGGSVRRRYSEEETVQRMLETAVTMAHEDGLRVSFDLQRLEDVIERAGVARSAVYKRWPRKEQFYSQVLLRLAGDGHPILTSHDSGTMRVVVEVAHAHPELWSTASGRRTLLIEMCRLGALHNFDTLRDRTEWQIYIALHATLLALPDNRFQEAMGEALRRSEHSFIQRMARFYESMLGLLGYRVRDGLRAPGYDGFATLGGAVVMGLVLTSGATSMLAEVRFQVDPFDTGSVQEWSLPALGFTSIAMSLVEENPSTIWDAARVDRVRAQLAEMLDQAPDALHLDL